MSGSSPTPSFADEQIAAHAQAADLVGLPWPERLRIVRQDRSYSTPSFIELAIALGRDLELPYAEREEWAQIGVMAAHCGDSGRLKELCPLAWATLGNVQRVRGKLSLSRSTFKRCRALRHHLTDGPELAEVYALEAAFCWQTEDLVNATALNRQALHLAKRYACAATIGCYEIQAGGIANDAEDWAAATTMLLSALDRLDPENNGRLAYMAGHNLATSAIGLGHLDTAMCALLRLQGVYPQFCTEENLLRHEWTVALIDKARAHRAEAELRLRAVRTGFLDRGHPYKAAQVDLELAKLAANFKRWPTAAHHAARAAAGLEAAGSPFEARVAAHLLREAVARRRGSA